MTYERAGEGIAQRIELEPGVTLGLVAQELRAERTGIHGRLSIQINNVEMAYSTFNLDRDEDRNRLANGAFKEFAQYLHRNKNGADTHYIDADFRKDVRRFCSGLWQARIDLDDVQAVAFAGTAAPIATEFVLRPYIVHEGGTIVFAHPGKGKSYLVGLMMVSIDAAADIDEAHEIWEVKRPRKVLFINLERGPLSVSNRLGNINQALGLPRTRPILTINARGKSLNDVRDAARRAIDQHGAEVVVLDSISRAGMGDLNENNPVNRIVDTLNGMAPTWLGIAHAPRGSDEHVYGSIHFEAGADVVVRLLSQQAEGGPLGVGLQIVKENDVGKHAMRLLALEFDGEFGLKRVRRPADGEFPDIEQGGLLTASLPMKEKVRLYMKERGLDGDTATHCANALKLDRAEVSRLFQTDAYYLVRTGDKNAKVYALCPPTHTRGAASDPAPIRPVEPDDVPF